VPSFLKTTSGGKAISGGALQPRSRRGNTNQVVAYWSGGDSSIPVEFLVLAGGGGAGGQGGPNAFRPAGGGGAGWYRTGI